MHSDTSPDAEALQIELFRQMTGEERIKRAFRLTDFMRRVTISRIRAEHPEWREWQIKRELLRLAFLPDPLPAGLDEALRQDEEMAAAKKES
jgi:hypothetical protein